MWTPKVRPWNSPVTVMTGKTRDAVKTVCHIIAPALNPENENLLKRELLVLESVRRWRPGNVKVILVCDSPDVRLYAEGFEVVVPKKTSKELGDPRGLVTLAEVLEIGVRSGADIVFYSNSDCCVGPKTYARLLCQENPVVQYHRLDVKGWPTDLDQVYNFDCEVSVTGVDGLSFTKEFYDGFLTKVDLNFYLGEPFWDVAVCGYLRKNGHEIYNSRDLYHPIHGKTWDSNNLTDAGRHNNILYRDYLEYVGLKSRELSFPSIKMSVIVVIYGDNDDRYYSLKKNLSRLEMQDLEVEWVIVESSGGKSRLSEYSRKRNHKHIFIQSNPSNEVIWQKEAMMNIGGKASKGRYVLFIDGDIYSDNNGWFRRIQGMMEKSAENIFLQPFSVCYDTVSLDQSFVGQCAQDAGYQSDFPHNPGLAVCLKRSVLDENGWLNSYAIFGSGDCCFRHEYLKKDRVNYVFEKFKTMQSIIRDVPVKCFPAYLDETIHHVYHGKVSKNYYVYRHEIIEKFKESLDKLVLVDDNGLMRWVDDGCEEKQLIRDMYRMKNSEWFDSTRIFKV